MITTSTAFDNAIKAVSRQIRVKAEYLKNGVASASPSVFTQNDRIVGFDIQRVGENSKFFGLTFCSRLNLKLIDKNRELAFSTNDIFIVSVGIVLPNGSTEYVTMPKFRVTEVSRDENTNQLSITAYDFMKQAELNNLDGFELSDSNTIAVMAEWIAQKIGCGGVEYINIPNDGNPFSFGTDTANYAVNETDGKKVTADSVSLRQVLKQIAEATQTVCYVSNENKLVFKRLTSSDTAVYNITKNDYFTLKSGDNRRLSEIASITELGDNINYKITEQSGSAQYIRDNPFFELRNDVADILTNAGTAIGTLTINEFDCSWRGNPALEIGDKITLTTKDEKTVAAYLLNDTITFNGGLNQKTEWKYDAEEAETANPTTIGEKLKQTSARVDKQNQIIELQAETIDGLAKEQAQIRIETNKINSCVKQEDYIKDKSDLQGQINANKDSVNESFT